VPKVQGGDDMIIDKENNIYTGLFDWTFYPSVEKYDQNGNLLKTYHLGKWEQVREGKYGYRSVSHWGGTGCIYSDNSGKLFIKYVKAPRNEPLFPGDSIPGNTEFSFQFGTTIQAFTFEQQMITLRIEGSWGITPNIPDGDKFFQQEVVQGRRGRSLVKLSFVDSKEGAQKGLLKEYMSRGEKPFGIDEEGIYTSAKDEKNSKINIIRKYTYSGDLVSTYTLNWEEGECEAFQTEYQPSGGVKKKMVFDKGNIYTYIHCKDGLKIIKWSPIEGKK